VCHRHRGTDIEVELRRMRQTVPITSGFVNSVTAPWQYQGLPRPSQNGRFQKASY